MSKLRTAQFYLDPIRLIDMLNYIQKITSIYDKGILLNFRQVAPDPGQVVKLLLLRKQLVALAH